MDAKERLIKNIMLKLSEILSEHQMEEAQNVLTVEFNDFEVEKKCTEVALSDNGNVTMLRNFVATKRLEGLSESSIKRYYDQNIKFIQFINRPLEEVETNDIRFYLSMIKRDNNLSDTTVDGIRRCLASFFSYLCVEDYILKNPILAIGKIRCAQTIRKPFSKEELVKIKSSCTTKRDAALVSFLEASGCRVSEVVRLNINDIEDNQCIVQGKGKKERMIFLSDKCLDDLRKYIDSRNDSSPALFVGKNTGRLSKSGIEQVISKLGKVNGIHAFPHKFRHTYATNLAENNMDIHKIAILLGHSSIQTTTIYSHIASSVKIKNEYMKIMNQTG